MCFDKSDLFASIYCGVRRPILDQMHRGVFGQLEERTVCEYNGPPCHSSVALSFGNYCCHFGLLLLVKCHFCARFVQRFVSCSIIRQSSLPLWFITVGVVSFLCSFCATHGCREVRRAGTEIRELGIASYVGPVSIVLSAVLQSPRHT